MSHRTAWHVIFGALLRERVPRGIEVRAEVPLGDEPQRADFLLLRRAHDADVADHGKIFRGLWRHLARDTLVEFKSASRPFRPADLVRLLGYGLQYLALPESALRHPENLSLAMVVPEVSAALEEEIARYGLRRTALEIGYHAVEGFPCPVVIAAIDDVADAEDDDLLRLFGRGKLRSRAAAQWFNRHVAIPEEGVNLEDLEGYDEIVDKFLHSLPVEQRLAGLAPEQRLAGLAPEQRLAGLAPEQRLAGLAPEQRLAGLAPEQRLAGLSGSQILLSLPDEVLAGLSDAYLASLPGEIREAVLRRREKKA